MLLNEEEFNKMVEIQFSNVKGLTDEMIQKCPKRHGLYVCHLFYCDCCCETYTPNPYGTRSFKNCVVFFDSMRVKQDRMGDKKSRYTLWDYSRSTVTHHLIGKYSSAHKSNQTKQNKNTKSANHSAIFNSFVFYIHNLKTNGSDTQYSDNVAMLAKSCATVGNRPHSENAVPIFEKIIYND